LPDLKKQALEVMSLDTGNRDDLKSAARILLSTIVSNRTGSVWTFSQNCIIFPILISYIDGFYDQI
jgi:hypothetical protein